MTRRDVGLMVKTVIATLSCLMAIWFFVSWVDVVLHNNCGGTQSCVNLFRIMFGK